MVAALPIILSILSALPGQLGQYFQAKQEIEKLKLETERQIEVERQKLAAQIAIADADLAKTTLGSTSPIFKYVSYGLLMGPFLIGLFFPAVAKEIFTNLSSMPEWYVQSFVLINFTIWGISASSPAVNTIFGGLQGFFKERRDYKIEKAKVDRKVFFEAMRAVKGVLSQDDVTRGNQALDKLEGK